MWRVVTIVLAVYVWGTPSFDGLRPAPLDRAVRNFHADLNHSAHSFTQQAGLVAQNRSVQFVDALRRGTSGLGSVSPIDRAAIAR
jgi:hypothetical protein